MPKVERDIIASLVIECFTKQGFEYIDVESKYRNWATLLAFEKDGKRKYVDLRIRPMLPEMKENSLYVEVWRDQ